jgi:hypothetical protein
VKTRPKRANVTTKVDLNSSRVYNASDIEDLSKLVFPSKNATHKRLAFILIWLAIKFSDEGKVTTQELDRQREIHAPELESSDVWKARATMARLGMIARKDMTYWQFSARFKNNLETMIRLFRKLKTWNGDIGAESKEYRLLRHVRAYIRDDEASSSTSYKH